MSIITNKQTQTSSLVTEVSSSSINLGRYLVKDELGVLKPVYPVEIKWAEITYEVDAAGNKIDVYENKVDGNVSLQPIEIYELYNEAITLADGTKTTMGEHLAKRADAILKTKLALTEIVS